MATGWSRWTKSHARDLYHPIGGDPASGVGQRHIGLSKLDPGAEGFASGVHPTPIAPPETGAAREAAEARRVWEREKASFQRRFGPQYV